MRTSSNRPYRPAPSGDPVRPLPRLAGRRALGASVMTPAAESVRGWTRRLSHGQSALLLCRASWSSCSPSLDSEVLITVPPYLLIASTALSGVTLSTMRKSAEVPGSSMPRTWSWNSLFTPDLVIFPISAPIPAPTAIPKTGMKNNRPNSRPQNMPQVAPPPTRWWLVCVWYLPSLSREITAIASGWMIRSWASRRASSAAACAVASSGYPMAIRSAMAPPFLSIRRCPLPGMPSILLAACRRLLTLARVNLAPGFRTPTGEGARPAPRSGKPASPLVDALPGGVADGDANNQHDQVGDDKRGRPSQPHEFPPAALADGRWPPGCRGTHGCLLPAGVPPTPPANPRAVYSRVATRMALMVCRRFSAWSKTMLAPELNTSPVTSRPEVMPVCSMISLPTVVLGSW